MRVVKIDEVDWVDVVNTMEWERVDIHSSYRISDGRKSIRWVVRKCIDRILDRPYLRF